MPALWSLGHFTTIFGFFNLQQGCRMPLFSPVEYSPSRPGASQVQVLRREEGGTQMSEVTGPLGAVSLCQLPKKTTATVPTRFGIRRTTRRRMARST